MPSSKHAELTDVVGFSGAPFNFVVGLDLEGKIVGVVLPAAGPSARESLDAPWRASWRAQAVNIVVLGVGLLVLTGLLVGMHRLTRHARLYEALRIGFLVFTLVWIGWIAGAQLSIINVFAWLVGVIKGNGLAVLLADPLLCVLLAFVVVSFFVWGRGVFCGWLCPFGALQEFLAKLARAVSLPQWSPSYRAHRVLWRLKYVSLAVLALTAFHGLQTMAIAAEIEPFKTGGASGRRRDDPGACSIPDSLVRGGDPRASQAVPDCVAAEISVLISANRMPAEAEARSPAAS